MPRALSVNYFATFVKNTNLLVVLLVWTSCFLDILYSLTSVLHCCTQLMKLKFKFNSELQLSSWNLITSYSSRSLSKVTPPLTQNLYTKYSARHNITFNPLKIGITTLIIVNCCQRRITACSGSQDWFSSLPSWLSTRFLCLGLIITTNVLLFLNHPAQCKHRLHRQNSEHQFLLYSSGNRNQQENKNHLSLLSLQKAEEKLFSMQSPR